LPLEYKEGFVNPLLVNPSSFGPKGFEKILNFFCLFPSVKFAYFFANYQKENAKFSSHKKTVNMLELFACD